MRKALCVLAVLLMGAGALVAQSETEDASGASLLAPVAPKFEAPEKPQIWVDTDADAEATERLLKQLREERVDEASFVKTPLKKVMETFEQEHGIGVLIELIALDELGLSPEEPITFRAPKDASIGFALSLMLEPLDLTYFVEGGVLIVSTNEVAWERLTVAVYPVADLLVHDEELGPDYSSLIKLILTTVATDTWAENGGSESEIVPYTQRGSLVITQTTAVHEEILKLLSALRKLPVDPRAKVLAEPQKHPQGGGGGSFAAPPE